MVAEQTPTNGQQKRLSGHVIIVVHFAEILDLED
jgi:hypothetical protein